MRRLLGLICLLLPTVVHSDVNPNIRIEYDEHTAPNGVIFEQLASQCLALSEEPSVSKNSGICVDTLWTRMNQNHRQDGSWTISTKPKYTWEQAVDISSSLRRMKVRAETRLDRLWRVFLCPVGRARPNGDDIFIAIEAIQDSNEVFWEQLRQQAVRDHGDVIVELTDKQRESMGFISKRHDLTLAWKDRRGPNEVLSDLCDQLGH